MSVVYQGLGGAKPPMSLGVRKMLRNKKCIKRMNEIPQGGKFPSCFGAKNLKGSQLQGGGLCP